VRALGCIRSEYFAAAETLAGAATAVCFNCRGHCVSDSCADCGFCRGMVGGAERLWKSEFERGKGDVDRSRKCRERPPLRLVEEVVPISSKFEESIVLVED
jgi:hypothetical protein